MKEKIIIASGNYGKIKEFREMLADYEILSYKDLGLDIEIEETGNTFYENALIKAKTVSNILHLDVLADDSGLCVVALNGEPGIFTARYAGDGSMESNINKLLTNMQGIKNRKAKFVCVLVLYRTSGEILSVEGETEGEILYEKTGENGFGYDPVFFSYELNMPFAVVPESVKNTVSHRFKAVQKLKDILDK